ncbi:cyclic AMP-dependent transcription factor ATF-6 alpha [Engraulis encrasicolus]|uniref:cyclic AMP-dependent transcription factor ATF-6 alpha n=1 Tax=Engraulis encrasicolus TaxID=184585 RepID=UPI002FD31933
MTSDLTLNFEDHLDHPTIMNDVADTGNICIDQDGEWDISLFDELEDLGDADALLQALEGVDCGGEVADLDFDMDLSPWSPDTSGDGSSTCTDGDMTGVALSPAHTLSSAHSPSSVEAHSPYSLPDEAFSPQAQASPLSVCSDSSGFSELPPERPPPKRTNQTPRAKPVKRPIQVSPRVSIQPRPTPVLTALPLPTAGTPLQPKTTIILQSLAPMQPLAPLQPVLPTVVKPTRVAIQPAPPAGRPVILPQPAQVLQIHTAPSIQTRVVTMPTLAPEPRLPAAVAPPLVSMTMPSPSPAPSSNQGSDDDSNASRRQQRMIKNRESACLSRKKKKEYLLTLEARLKVALSENAHLKNENGTLKQQLQGLVSENTVLKATAPKRRAVCLMVLVVFLVFNIGPMSLTDSDGSKILRSAAAGRHLLEFDPDTQAPEEATLTSSLEDSISEEKGLMVVKKAPLIIPGPAACQPPVNRTKCIKLAHELRGWVHRHEVQRTKSRRQINTDTKSRTILEKENGSKDEVTQILPVQYTDSAEQTSGNELQVYYAPHRTYNEFFDEINRRGDTFYVVSFRRDHLLLPATNHHKGRRPKMSVVLPAMNINDSVIKDQDYEVMMQIDCEVMDTRILHVKSSSIPPFLRANQTTGDTVYHANPANGTPTPTTMGVLVGAA